MTDQQTAAVGGLLALGLGAFAVGKRKADRQCEQSRDRQHQQTGDDYVEVPIRG